MILSKEPGMIVGKEPGMIIGKEPATIRRSQPCFTLSINAFMNSVKCYRHIRLALLANRFRNINQISSGLKILRFLVPDSVPSDYLADMPPK